LARESRKARIRTYVLEFHHPQPICRAAIDDGVARRDQLLTESRRRREAQGARAVRQHEAGEPADVLLPRPGVDRGRKLAADAAAPVAAQHVDVGVGVVVHAGRDFPLGKGTADDAFAVRTGDGTRLN
jgi:hypothetical protein